MTLTLTGYRTELQRRGFSGFDTADLDKYVNWARYRIARRFRWRWELTSGTFTVAAGEATEPLSTLSNFRTMKRINCTTSDVRKELLSLREEDFLNIWLPKDLTGASYRGEPSHYYLWNKLIYILPPPSASRDFEAYYYQKLAPLTQASEEETLIDDELEELVVSVAEVICHRRTNEPELSFAARLEADQLIDEFLREEGSYQDQGDDRVIPYQWNA